MNRRTRAPLDSRPARAVARRIAGRDGPQLAKRTAASNVISGLEKRWRAGDKLRLNGKDYSRDELVALFRAQIDALDAIRAARVALTVVIARERGIARRLESMTPDVRDVVTIQFGSGADVLGDFGWVAFKKPGPKTAEAKRVGAEKLRATRKARGTMGKRQRRKSRR
jgi:hypothetical protein